METCVLRHWESPIKHQINVTFSSEIQIQMMLVNLYVTTLNKATLMLGSSTRAIFGTLYVRPCGEFTKEKASAFLQVGLPCTPSYSLHVAKVQSVPVDSNTAPTLCRISNTTQVFKRGCKAMGYL